MVILLHRAKNRFELLHRYPSAGSIRDVGMAGYKQLQSANPSGLPTFNGTETMLFRNLERMLMKFDMQYF